VPAITAQWIGNLTEVHRPGHPGDDQSSGPDERPGERVVVPVG
jgi:hypothetical protein